jgi:hypothetical protein
MDQLCFRCQKLDADVTIDVGIDALSLERLRETEIGLQCRCGEMHRVRIGELYRCIPQGMPELRLRDTGTSGISA